MEPGLSTFYLGLGTGVKGKICQANSSQLTPRRRRKLRTLQCVGSDLSLGPAMCSATTHGIISLPKPLHNASTRKPCSASSLGSRNRRGAN